MDKDNYLLLNNELKSGLSSNLKNCVNLNIIEKSKFRKWNENCSEDLKNWIKTNSFKPISGATLFFPDNQPNYVNVFIETPLGTDIETTNKISIELERRITAAVQKDSVIIEAILTQVGEKTADPNEGTPSMGSSPNKARITVSFFEYEKRVFLSDVNTSDIMSNINISYIIITSW